MAERREIRRRAADAGIEISGLHFLLLTPEGLSITTDDADIHQRTVSVMCDLVELCADLGGKVLVHGSPLQRQVGPGEAARAKGWDQAKIAFGAAARVAERCGVTYCVEALSTRATTFINRIDDAVRMVREVDSAGLRTMIDTSAAAQMESEPIADLIRRWCPTGLIAHVHVNDRNRRGPGQGEDRFASVFRALRDVGYGGAVSVEPFDYHPDARTAAARAAGYIAGILEAIAEDRA
jgi:sugar phosphate isomerase/epimerase